MSEEHTLNVKEIFGYTIQGEGTNSGRLALFLRLAGCDSNCKWCDTPEARNMTAGAQMTYNDIIKAFDKLTNFDWSKLERIVVTGGNPCIQDLSHFVEFIISNYISENKFNNDVIKETYFPEFCIETQGTVLPTWLYSFNHITISPKPLSAISGGQNIDKILEFYKHHYDMVMKLMNNDNNINFKDAYIYDYPRIPIIELKIVVFDEEDLKWSIDAINKVYEIIGARDYYRTPKFYQFTLQLCTPIHQQQLTYTTPLDIPIKYKYTADLDKITIIGYEGRDENINSSNNNMLITNFKISPNQKMLYDIIHNGKHIDTINIYWDKENKMLDITPTNGDIRSITLYCAEKELKAPISTYEILHYLHNNECKVNIDFLHKVRILPQIHRLVNVA